MKKIRISIVLLAGWIMLLLCGAAAETQTIPSIRDTVDSAVKPFSFRNGVLWGMDSAQVQSTESIQMDERSSGEWSVMVSSEPVEVSRFTADLIYMFRDNALQMIAYEFQTCTTLNYQYLTGALSAVYGESQTADATRIKAYMDLLYPDRYRTDWITHMYVWHAEDGTCVFMYYYSSEAYAILYVNPQLMNNVNGYAVNGL